MSNNAIKNPLSKRIATKYPVPETPFNLCSSCSYSPSDTGKAILPNHVVKLHDGKQNALKKQKNDQKQLDKTSMNLNNPKINRSYGLSLEKQIEPWRLLNHSAPYRCIVTPEDCNNKYKRLPKKSLLDNTTKLSIEQIKIPSKVKSLNKSTSTHINIECKHCSLNHKVKTVEKHSDLKSHDVNLENLNERVNIMGTPDDISKHQQDIMCEVKNQFSELINTAKLLVEQMKILIKVKSLNKSTSTHINIQCKHCSLNHKENIMVEHSDLNSDNFNLEYLIDREKIVGTHDGGSKFKQEIMCELQKQLSELIAKTKLSIFNDILWMDDKHSVVSSNKVNQSAVMGTPVVLSLVCHGDSICKINLVDPDALKADKGSCNVSSQKCAHELNDVDNIEVNNNTVDSSEYDHLEKIHLQSEELSITFAIQKKPVSSFTYNLDLLFNENVPDNVVYETSNSQKPLKTYSNIYEPLMKDYDLNKTNVSNKKDISDPKSIPINKAEMQNKLSAEDLAIDIISTLDANADIEYSEMKEDVCRVTAKKVKKVLYVDKATQYDLQFYPNYKVRKLNTKPHPVDYDADKKTCSNSQYFTNSMPVNILFLKIMSHAKNYHYHDVSCNTRSPHVLRIYS